MDYRLGLQRALHLWVVIAITTAALGAPLAAQPPESSFGRYIGYSEPIYDGWSRHSKYVTMPDGVDLAVTYSIPTLAGAEATEALPVILLYTGYLRVWEQDGEVVTFVDNAPFIQELVQRGYVLAILDAGQRTDQLGYGA